MAKKPESPARIPPADAGWRVIVLHGPEAFLRTECTARQRELLEKTHGNVDTITFDGATAQPADILDECRSFGLIAAHKLVIVDEADQAVKDAARPMFERYAEAPSADATLLLRGSTWRAGKLDELIERVGVIIRCEPPDPARAVAWAIQRCARRHAATLEPDAAEALVERLGPGLGRLDTELEKLAVAASARVGPGEATPKIPLALVDELVVRAREENAWEIKSRLLTHSAEELVRNVRELLDVSRQSPQQVRFHMVDLARALHALSRVSRSGGNTFSTAGRLKLFGPAKDVVLQAARQVRPEQAHALLTACIEADARAKSGFGEAERSLDVLAVRFAMLQPES